MPASTPPRFTPSGPGQAKRPPSRFDINPAMDGYEVVDFDGRAVIDGLDAGLARVEADRLNAVAMNGPRAVAKAIANLSTGIVPE